MNPEMPLNDRAPRIAIIDYGIGNLRSVEKALQRSGCDAFLTSDGIAIESADGVVLPGVGAMGRCVEALNKAGLRNAALDSVASGRPFLGVCVGMQMLHAGSTEYGGVEGLGVFDSVVHQIQPFEDGVALKVPHMQWNQLIATAPSRLLDGALAPGASSSLGLWVYFVHSFAAQQHADVVAVAQYGGPVVAVVERDNVMGTQFHPEKSGSHGLSILKSFGELCRSHVIGASGYPAVGVAK